MRGLQRAILFHGHTLDPLPRGPLCSSVALVRETKLPRELRPGEREVILSVEHEEPDNFMSAALRFGRGRTWEVVVEFLGDEVPEPAPAVEPTGEVASA